MMQWRLIKCLALLMALVILAGCADSREMQAAKVCEAAAKERAVGKIMAVDLNVLRDSAVMESESVMRLQAPVTLDTGLQSEYTQTINCRVQWIDDNAQVVNLVFVF